MCGGACDLFGSEQIHTKLLVNPEDPKLRADSEAGSGMEVLGVVVGWAVLVLVANLMFANTEILGVTVDSTAAMEFNPVVFILNMLPVGLICAFTMKAVRDKRVYGSWLASVFALYAISVVVNYGTSVRVFGSASFLVCLTFSLRRPEFLAAVFRKLMDWSVVIGFVMIVYIAALNWGSISLTFNYTKASGDAVRLPFKNPNILSQVLDMVGIVLAAGVMNERSRGRRIAGLALLVGLGNLVLGTECRGAVLHFLLVSGVVVSWHLWGGRVQLGRLVGLGAVAVLCGYVLVGAISAGRDSSGIWSRFFTGENEDILGARSVTQEAWAQLKENRADLMFGKGAGAGIFHVSAVDDLEFERGFGAHNSYVDSVAQFGFPFTAILAGLTLSALYAMWVRVRSTSYGCLWLLLLICGVHPLFEDYYFFRFGSGCDLVRFSLFAFIAEWAFRDRGNLAASSRGWVTSVAGSGGARRVDGSRPGTGEVWGSIV